MYEIGTKFESDTCGIYEITGYSRMDTRYVVLCHDTNSESSIHKQEFDYMVNAQYLTIVKE